MRPTSLFGATRPLLAMLLLAGACQPVSALDLRPDNVFVQGGAGGASAVIGGATWD